MPAPAALADDLRRFVAGEPIAARHPGAFERAAKWSRRNPAWAAALTVAFVALVTVAGVIGAYSLRLKGALSDVQSQNRRADENLAELRKAVDQFAGLILDEPQLRAVDLTETRRKLLTSAVTAYEKIIAQAGDGEELLTAQGDAHFRLGLILSQLGRNAESEQHNVAAITVWERLVERYPDKSRYRVQLAGSLHNRGKDLEVLGRSAEAEAPSSGLPPYAGRDSNWTRKTNSCVRLWRCTETALVTSRRCPGHTLRRLPPMEKRWN